ncbi:MAG TPA: membrane protein insertion efficiency factor YidD [Terriglobales bacterium]|nr:membrane protein insertion efficiency factor YidD [Terriglobales bacterium]
MNEIAKTVLLTILRGYKWAFSPLLPPACRYVPTCSEYATEAVERYGALRGSGLAIWRLLRCQPFATAGFDPVPISTAAECGRHHISLASQPHA